MVAGAVADAAGARQVGQAVSAQAGAVITIDAPSVLMILHFAVARQLSRTAGPAVRPVIGRGAVVRRRAVVRARLVILPALGAVALIEQALRQIAGALAAIGAHGHAALLRQ